MRAQDHGLLSLSFARPLLFSWASQDQLRLTVMTIRSGGKDLGIRGLLAQTLEFTAHLTRTHAHVKSQGSHLTINLGTHVRARFLVYFCFLTK